MIKLTPEQLYKKIIDDQIKLITWYEGYVANPKEMRQHFHRFKDEDPNAVLANANLTLSQYPGLFTVMMYKTTTGTSEPPIVLRVETMGSQGTMMQGVGGQQQPAMNYEQMYQKVLADVKNEMELQNLKNQVEMYKNQLQGFKTAGGKLAYVGTEMLMHYLKIKQPNLAKNLQGFTDFEDVTNHEKAQDKKEEKVTEIKDKQKLARSLETILNALGEDTFNKVAELLEKDPSKAELLKSFL